MNLLAGTQEQLLGSGGIEVLRTLVSSSKPYNHNTASIIFWSMSKNPKVHVTIAKSGILPLLLVLRSSKDVESRKLALDSLLGVLLNSV